MNNINFPCGGWFYGHFGATGGGGGRSCNNFKDCKYCSNPWDYAQGNITLVHQKEHGASGSVELKVKCECNKWISVEKKLPKLEKYVLGYCKLPLYQKFVEVVRMNNNVKTKWWCDRYGEAVIVEYWMPLPNPPEEK